MGEKTDLGANSRSPPLVDSACRRPSWLLSRAGYKSSKTFPSSVEWDNKQCLPPMVIDDNIHWELLSIIKTRDRYDVFVSRDKLKATVSSIPISLIRSWESVTWPGSQGWRGEAESQSQAFEVYVPKTSGPSVCEYEVKSRPGINPRKLQWAHLPLRSSWTSLNPYLPPEHFTLFIYYLFIYFLSILVIDKDVLSSDEKEDSTRPVLLRRNHPRTRHLTWGRTVRASTFFIERWKDGLMNEGRREGFIALTVNPTKD